MTRMTLPTVALRLLAGLAALWTGAALAIQPVAQGLQPLLARLQAIATQQQTLNLRLQSAATPAPARAMAYRRYQEIEQERLQLVCDVRRARELDGSWLVSFATSDEPAHCAARPTRVSDKDTPRR